MLISLFKRLSELVYPNLSLNLNLGLLLAKSELCSYPPCSSYKISHIQVYHYLFNDLTKRMFHRPNILRHFK